MQPHITLLTEEAAHPLVQIADAAFQSALAVEPDPRHPILAVPGMSGRRYRLFLNTLLHRLPDASYLEIGTYKGATLCAAIYGNQVRAVAIDDWSQFGGPRQQCLANVARLKPPSAEVTLLERDFRSVDYAALGHFDVYMFDGPHGHADQIDGIVLAAPALKPCCVLVVDDWNWRRVREGTRIGLQRIGRRSLWSAEVRTTLDESHPAVHGAASDWHNGYLIAVLTGPAIASRYPLQWQKGSCP